MNNFERNIYEQLFAQKIDFFTRSINNVVVPERKLRSVSPQVNEQVEEVVVHDENTPLDINEEDQPSSNIAPSKKLSAKSKKVIGLVTVLLFLATIFTAYFLYSSTTDNEQIVAYKVNSETGKRINNMKYFIDSNTKGYIVSNKSANIQNALSDFIKNFDRSELDLDVNSIPYINLVSDDLKKQFSDNEDTINGWLKKVEEIRYQEKSNVEEFNNAKQKATTAEQNSSLISFYKAHNVFDLIVEANKVYKNNKEVFDAIGDISFSDKVLTSISFDQIAGSQYINYDNLIANLKSYTADKYHNQKLITSTDVKVVTESELKEFAQNLEDTSFSEVNSKYALNVNDGNLETFANDFEKLKAELRKTTNVVQNEDNDLTKRIQDQKFVQKVKELFTKFDRNEDIKYCLRVKKTELEKSTASSEAKAKALLGFNNQCNDEANAREKAQVKANFDAPGVIQSVGSRMYQGQKNGEFISLVLFENSKAAKKYLEDYTKKIEETKKLKNVDFEVSSVLYNNSNMIVIIPNGNNDEITKYLAQVQISNWTYFDYYEQMVDSKKLTENKDDNEDTNKN